jgi:hypothetical protein
MCFLPPVVILKGSSSFKHRLEHEGRSLGMTILN